MGGFDPAAMQELNLTAVFAPSLTPSQETTLARLEHLLSLAEGWISARGYIAAPSRGCPG